MFLSWLSPLQSRPNVANRLCNVLATPSDMGCRLPPRTCIMPLEKGSESSSRTLVVSGRLGSTASGVSSLRFLDGGDKNEDEAKLVGDLGKGGDLDRNGL